jgi:uncharacterized protein YggL (DUF469 family)
MENKADIYQAIKATKVGHPPLVINAVITTNQNYIAGGVPQDATHVESYVCLSALPRELQERVRTAVQAIISGM